MKIAPVYRKPRTQAQAEHKWRMVLRRAGQDKRTRSPEAQRLIDAAMEFYRAFHAGKTGYQARKAGKVRRAA